MDKLNSNYELKHVSAVAEYGVKLKFNHVFPEKRNQNLRPSFRQTISLLPLVCR